VLDGSNNSKSHTLLQTTSTTRVSLKGYRKLQMGTLAGSSSVVANTESSASVPTGTGTPTINVRYYIGLWVILNTA
jgi:hypothetical protein